jgi:hypothetical protein
MLLIQQFLWRQFSKFAFPSVFLVNYHIKLLVANDFCWKNLNILHSWIIPNTEHRVVLNFMIWFQFLKYCITLTSLYQSSSDSELEMSSFKTAEVKDFRSSNTDVIVSSVKKQKKNIQFIVLFRKINISILWKECLSSDCQQFHHNFS